MRSLAALRRAVDAMVRGPYVTLVGAGTICVAVFITGFFAAALSGAERLLAAWAGEVRISVYLAKGADLERARAAAAKTAAPHHVEAVPSALGLKRLAESLGEEARILEGIGPDAVPDAVEVSVPGISLAAAHELAGRLRNVPGAAEVDYGNSWLEQLERFVARARTAGILLLAFLSLATALLVSNTLRLAVFARREEIEIMKLVGATDGFVTAPFLIEGLAQGLLGAGVAVASLLGLYAAIAPRLRAAVRVAEGLQLRNVLPWPLVGALLAGGAAVGLLASALSVARHLRTR